MKQLIKKIAMNRRLLFATLLYLLFVIYGSLVPLEFRNIGLDTAIAQFKNIQTITIGTEHRADWIANIILYIPLAGLAAANLNAGRQGLTRLLWSLTVLIFCLTVALGIEFSQLFFPPRTVSENDLIAETLGTLIGLSSWQLFGNQFAQLYAQLLRGTWLSASAAIIFYLLLYVPFSLFPFDFVTSFAELNVKLDTSADTLFFPFEQLSAEPLRCLIKWLVEMLTVLPLGVLFCYLPSISQRLLVAVLVGLMLGLSLETLQVFLLSGSGQGFSVLTRMMGMGAGVVFYDWAKQRKVTELIHWASKAVWFVLPPYLLLVFFINGWFASDWLSLEQATTKLAETHFLPLYYFYYTTESIAFVSLLSNIGLYLPIGLLCWLRSAQRQWHWFSVGALAAALALLVEIGKLFLADKHADPSDVWLAFGAASGCYIALQRFMHWQQSDKTVIANIPDDHEQSVPQPLMSVQPAEEVDRRWRNLSLLLWGIIATALWHYPLGSVWLGVFFVAYTALLVCVPYAWLLVVPAALPLLDLTPWTGRFFFDEFDLLILSTLAIYYWHKPKTRQRSLLSLVSVLFIVSFSLCYVVSLSKGLLPLPSMNANAFNHYYSNYNSLRVAKGFFWSVLLLPYLQLTWRRYRYTPYYFAYGVLLGLAGMSLFVLIERAVFVSLGDFTSDYRINALFSTMHAGGGHLESYLMLSLPFIAVLFVKPLHRFSTPIGVLLFALGLYALLVSFSRGGYIGFSVGFVVLLCSLLVCLGKSAVLSKKTLWLIPVLLIGALLAVPVLRGSLIQQRFDVAKQDKDSRSYHWRDALAMRDDDFSTTLFGMGLGSYPRSFFWLNTENTHPATYEIAQEQNNQYLRLRGGDALFFGQYLPIAAHSTYRLVLDMRGETSNLVLGVSLCEKSVQYALRCVNSNLSTTQTNWQHIEQTINSNEVGEPVVAGLLRRPIQLAFYNGNAGGQLIDVDNVQLLDSSGQNRLANGDFAQDSDFWFFAAEKHNPWHIFNFWVHLLFDQGWLGVVAFALLFASAIYWCGRRLLRGNVFAAIYLTAFSGFMVVGFVDSAFDAPRLTLLFFFMLFFALLRTPSLWLRT